MDGLKLCVVCVRQLSWSFVFSIFFNVTEVTLTGEAEDRWMEVKCVGGIVVFADQWEQFILANFPGGFPRTNPTP